MNETPALNTDRELFRESTGEMPSDYYENSVHVTADGKIGMNVGGMVITLPIAKWHALAMTDINRDAHAVSVDARETLAMALFKWDTEDGPCAETNWSALSDQQQAVWLSAADVVTETGWTPPRAHAVSPALRDAVAKASYAYDKALNAYEDALATRDPAVRTAAETQLHEAGRVLSAAQFAVTASQPSGPLTFTTLLNDPTQQLDPKGEVMASIRAYQNATKATADAALSDAHAVSGVNSEWDGVWPEFGPCAACGARDLTCHNHEGCCDACRATTTMHAPKEKS